MNNVYKANEELIDTETISMIDKKLLEVEIDEEKGVKWLTREEANALMK